MRAVYTTCPYSQDAHRSGPVRVISTPRALDAPGGTVSTSSPNPPSSPLWLVTCDSCQYEGVSATIEGAQLLADWHETRMPGHHTTLPRPWGQDQEDGE